MTDISRHIRKNTKHITLNTKRSVMKFPLSFTTEIIQCIKAFNTIDYAQKEVQIKANIKSDYFH